MTDVTPEQNGGVIKTVLREGSGDSPMTGDTVSVHYVGTLPDSGEQFDSSRDRGDKFEFKLGVGQVIKGWDLGVASMKRGELCELLCLSDYAYGDSGSPPKIPPKATLKFEVELFDFFGEDVSEDKDKSVLKRTHTSGAGYATPNDGATLNCKIECFTVPGNESVGKFASNTMLHGEESAYGLPKCVEKVIDDMKSGEKCEITVTPKHGFKEANAAFPNAPLNESVKFVIDLKSFEKCKESWEMSSEEKIEQSTVKRNSATKYLKEGKYELAIKLFEKIINILEDEVKRPNGAAGDYSDSDSEKDQDGAKEAEERPDDEDKETDPRVVEIMEASNLNLSLCYLKTKSYVKAIEHCDNVLDATGEAAKQDKKEKALFRKGECHFLLHEYETAKSIFAEVMEKYPNNSAAKKRHYECDKMAKEELRSEKERYQKMFKNFST